MGKKEQLAELLGTLGDFTSKENWDKFFTIRGTDDSFEWYAEWSELRDPLLSHLPPQPQILVPGCGSSRLSEHLYDAGFTSITNIDFSKVAISDCLRRNVRHRPDMRWRVMDMTAMQFSEEAFDVVVDKGGLDALMEPEMGPKLGDQYLSEVRRVLKCGGKFVCLTLAESHVLALLFSKYRFGWKMGIDAIPQKPSGKPSLQAYMVVAEKEVSSVLQDVTISFNKSSFACRGSQASGLLEAVDKENQIRREYFLGSDVLYSLEELNLGARGDLTKLSPGSRFQLNLGGGSRFSYRAVVLDSQESSGPFAYHCGVFIVPKTRAHEWLFSSEEGQWMVVESSKAARLVMILLDASHVSASMDDIQKDLSPLVKQLAPGKDDNGAQIPFMMASDGIKQRDIVHQVTSTITGPIIVEDVIYETVDGDISRILPSRELTFRRLVFQRSEGLVQSEALLSEEGSNSKVVGETERKKTNSSSRSKRKGIQKRSGETSHQLKVYHGYLASSYHTGIISGLMLISSYLEGMASAHKSVKAVVIGLGAGLLPMFLNRCLPFVHTEVVELDPVVLKLAKEYFGFVEDDCLQAHVADGIQFVRNIANSAASDETSLVQDEKDAQCNTSSNGDFESKVISKVDILVIDVDSADSSSGMTCPAADFVDESFLQTVKDALSEKGLFIINLVSRSQAIKDTVISRMKVFSHLFSLQLEEDVNEVIFGLCSASCIEEVSFPEAALQLEKLLKLEHTEISQSIINTTKKLRHLK
ncbi:eEF1A lysine and N-terminal methyltransferase isoform X2 [Pyrus x bretschneideri]|uniref:eEF1A lysine and N-terminal methyltransferase isoform X2 n=1 Tax=Pyrus x bretschneideri TaxID=225117 RepID=UPI0020301F07|nr:eEF1A lysine and N-terminal methyltransferase isoform X2 [Pyrus x bretschneideri]